MAQSIKDKLQELEKQNNLLKDNIIDAVWIINAGNLICENITPSIYRISGYTAEELIDKRITDRLVPKSMRHALVSLEMFIDEYESGDRTGTRTHEFEVAHKNGGTYWVEISAKLMEEPGGKIKIVGTTRDITARKRAEPLSVNVVVAFFRRKFSNSEAVPG